MSQRIAEGDPDSIVWHRHADAHFILVHAGRYYVSLAPGAGEPLLIYNPPGTTHRDHFRGGRGSYSAISLGPASAAALAPLQTPDEPCRLTTPAQRALARRIVAQCAAPTCSLTLEALASELLEDTCTQELTLTQVADVISVPPVHLTRTFRRHLYCTPGAFVRYRRLDRAAGLLAGSARPLAEVALDSGCADQSHFTHSFGRLWGEPQRLPPAGRERSTRGRVCF